jgi:hypothetical protein
MDGIKSTRRQVIQEVPWGMWVWRCDDGTYIADEDGNFMHVFVDSTKPAVNEAARAALKREAKAYGIEDGKAVFWAGRRPIDDEQLQYQLARAAAGLIPDPFDVAAIKEEERVLKSGR